MTSTKKEASLVSEFSRESRSVPKATNSQIASALSAYFNPSEQKTALSPLMDSIVEISFNGKTDPKSKVVAGELKKLTRELKGARRFDDNYIGHMLTRASIPGLIGMFLGEVSNSNTVAREVSFVESDMEKEAIQGLAHVIGYDPEVADGTFTSGGSTAILTALLARRTQMESAGARATNTHPYVVLGTEYTHYSWEKMIRILGGPINSASEAKIVKKNIGTEAFKMNPKLLKAALEKERKAKNPLMAVIALGGETETGLVDPIAELAEVAKAYDVPLIVDGAYGAPYRLSRNGDLFAGMEESYATILDSHKCLHTPYSNGSVIFQKKEDGFYGFGERESYLGKGEHLGHKRIEGSMGPGAILSTIAVLRTLGESGLKTIYDLSLDRIEYLFDRILKSDYLAPLHNPEINILCFALKPKLLADLGLSSLKEIEEFIDSTRYELDNGVRGGEGKGGYFFSSTSLPVSSGEGFVGYTDSKDNLQKVPVYRSVIMNPFTTNEIIENAVIGLEKIIKKRLKRKGK
jgi:glutamate/tyrosine decarboxylase-like PLP-dependent enzyme